MEKANITLNETEIKVLKSIVSKINSSSTYQKESIEAYLQRICNHTNCDGSSALKPKDLNTKYCSLCGVKFIKEVK